MLRRENHHAALVTRPNLPNDLPPPSAPIACDSESFGLLTATAFAARTPGVQYAAIFAATSGLLLAGTKPGGFGTPFV